MTRPVTTARSVAFACLLRIDADGAYANIVLPAMLTETSLERRDRAFATELVYGTTRMRRACDALVDRFIVKEPSAELRTLLRLGAYQLHFAGVSAHAAVGETVELAPKRSRGFVNAILRQVQRHEMVWPDEATRLSYPSWIVCRLQDELGVTDAHDALATMNLAAPVTERADGYIQDVGSQWVANAVDAQPGEVVLDVCAAPGGKATAIAADGAFVIAADVRAPRTRLIADNVRRLGADVCTVVADGTAPPFAAAFDRVLIDAPCSGLGTLRRRADARWRITEHDVTELVALQRRLLRSSAQLVKPGGVLVYSVCTLLAVEATDHPVPDGFEVVDQPPSDRWSSVGSGFRLLPQVADTDGMMIVRYRRLR